MAIEALVLTEKAAEERGYVGDGPFGFGGLFPGEWMPGVPLRIDVLGFDSEDEALDALEESGVPLERTTVQAGEGLPLRFNHAAGELEAREAQADLDRAGQALDPEKIRTHAQADDAAIALNISFPEGATVADKRDAIAAMIEGAAVDTTGAETELLTEGNPPPGGDGGGGDQEGGS
jgi:hypothetical protein